MSETPHGGVCKVNKTRLKINKREYCTPGKLIRKRSLSTFMIYTARSVMVSIIVLVHKITIVTQFMSNHR